MGVDLFACGWLMLVGGGVCVRFVTLSKCGPDGPGAAAPSLGVGPLLRCPLVQGQTCV